MERYYVYQFDSETYVVADGAANREICICSEFGEVPDAEQRAMSIAGLLNREMQEKVSSDNA